MTVDTFASSVYRSMPSMISTPGMAPAMIGDDGRIMMPGFPAGLSIESYLQVTQMYTSILEANRILDRFRPQLGILNNSNPQDPLTPLQPSTFSPYLFYKREDLTITRAYKVRGAVVGMAKMMQCGNYRQFITASTGNHALGLFKAAALLRPDQIQIVVPTTTAAVKLTKLKQEVQLLNALGVHAALIEYGSTFDEARDFAKNQTQHGFYLDPYSDPWVVAGQGTLGLELYQQLLPILQEQEVSEISVVAPVGGGGLLTGTAVALKMAAAWDARFRGININFTGLCLESLDTVYGDAIRVNKPALQNQALLEVLHAHFECINDADMRSGMNYVLSDLGALVEGPSGATTRLCYEPKDTRQAIQISILSGGNCTTEILSSV